MSCNHPLLATWTTDPKKPVKIISKAPFLDRPTFKMINESYVVNPHTGEAESEYFLVRCGQCMGCRLDKSREWADRLTMESMMHEEGKSLFITLTYDDEHLPAGRFTRPTLVKEHAQKFMKDLRRWMDYHLNIKEIRFYLCGEYGSKYLRPHYHVILFGAVFPDMEKWFLNHMHQQIYKSEILDGIWQRGITCIGSADWRSCAYTARYVTKKIKGEGAEDYYSIRGILPEFQLMSNREGIGLSYFESHYEEIYENDSIVLPPIDGKAHICKPPRYFDDKYKEINPLHLERVKAKRMEIAQDSMETYLHLTDLDMNGYFAMREEIAKRSEKLLKRLVDQVLTNKFYRATMVMRAS